MMRLLIKLVLLWVFAGFILMIYVFSNAAFKMAYGCLKSSEWVLVKAELTSAKVERSEFDDMARYSKVYYRPSIQYHYEYQGGEYFGDRYSWTGVYDNDEYFSAAKQLVKNYESGSLIDVYIDPHYPNISVVERCNKGSYVKLFIFGFVFFVIALGFIWFTFRKRR
ncbi:DUF3592 domain-containing protein [Vibrio vulnificus]|nr:DUF3592 domain-containing protein [Vibrio vulnificus]HAS8133293.1 DUF3592 domain-containing protein [Vibrio vulnificus]HAS8387696.1 DUF3592 domain-containing protein [Vibrio vulnificus]